MCLWVIAEVGSPNLSSGSSSLLTTGKDCHMPKNNSKKMNKQLGSQCMTSKPCWRTYCSYVKLLSVRGENFIARPQKVSRNWDSTLHENNNIEHDPNIFCTKNEYPNKTTVLSRVNDTGQILTVRSSICIGLIPASLWRPNSSSSNHPCSLTAHTQTPHTSQTHHKHITKHIAQIEEGNKKLMLDFLHHWAGEYWHSMIVPPEYCSVI